MIQKKITMWCLEVSDVNNKISVNMFRDEFPDCENLPDSMSICVGNRTIDYIWFDNEKDLKWKYNELLGIPNYKYYIRLQMDSLPDNCARCKYGKVIYPLDLIGCRCTVTLSEDNRPYYKIY